MFYINNSYNNNIHCIVCKDKEELISKIDKIKSYEGVTSNSFYVADCNISIVESVTQKIENWAFIFDAQWSPVFETQKTEMMEEWEKIFEFDVINWKATELKALLSKII